MKNASYCVSYGKEGRLQQNEQKNSFCYSPFFYPVATSSISFLLQQWMYINSSLPFSNFLFLYKILSESNDITIPRTTGYLNKNDFIYRVGSYICSTIRYGIFRPSSSSLCWILTGSRIISFSGLTSYSSFRPATDSYAALSVDMTLFFWSVSSWLSPKTILD